MLAIEVAFLTGRYVATAYNSRTESEWPPHPARLFSALAATHVAADATTTTGREGERAILEWLERQDAPSIVASDAARRDVVTVFVPVNDVALTDVDEEATQLDQARASLADAEKSGDAKAIKRHVAEVRKADANLKKAVTRATDVPSKVVSPSYGLRVLPDHRLRQQRTFPSVTPDVPRVTFVWPNAVPTDSQRSLMDGLLQRVVRLGHSSSLVSVRLVDDADTPTWRPADEGEEIFRGIEPGQLAALQSAFQHHREVEPRVMPFAPHNYTRSSAKVPEDVPPSTFSNDWLVLRRVGGPSLPITSTAGVARAVRRTLMSYADEPIPEVLSGHATDGRASAQIALGRRAAAIRRS